METFKITLNTFKGFNRYEWLTFVTFLISSMVAFLEGELYYSFIILLGCVWIFTSAGYRQDVKVLLETQHAKAEIDNTPQQVESLSSVGITKGVTKIEYALVEDSIFDLRNDFEQGKLYEFDSGAYEVITDLHLLSCRLEEDACYRRIEKEVDWKEEVKSYLESISQPEKFEGNFMTVSNSEWNSVYELSDEEYMEMCRVTLRAIGEIE